MLHNTNLFRRLSEVKLLPGMQIASVISSSGWHVISWKCLATLTIDIGLEVVTTYSVLQNLIPVTGENKDTEDGNLLKA